MTSLVHSTKFVLRPSGCRSVSPGSSGLRVGAIPMQVFIFGGNLDRLPIRFDFNIYCRGRSVWLRAQCVSTCFSLAGSGDLSEETQADKCCRASAAVRIQAHLFRTRQFLRLLRSYCLGYGQVTLKRSSEACLWYTTTDSKRISGSVVASDESPALAAGCFFVFVLVWSARPIPAFCPAMPLYTRLGLPCKFCSALYRSDFRYHEAGTRYSCHILETVRSSVASAVFFLCSASNRYSSNRV